MSWTASSLTSISVLLVAGCAMQPAAGTLLHAEDFATAENWVLEAEQPTARVVARGGVLHIDTPAGLTLWFKPRLTGPVEIEFEAMAVSEGGRHDQVSDLNVFWMATNRDGGAPMSPIRAGRFEAYNDLRTYYVGLGGNRNTTTRFRRYIGDPVQRPLLPGHDLRGADTLLIANRWQRITLLADGSRIEYRRDGQVLFAFEDPAPYTTGWFALRTTKSHLRIRHLRIHSRSGGSRPATYGHVARGPRFFPLIRVDAVGVGVYNARPLAKAP
ncbi:MAG TPA: DUF6250 domain-containing protein [Steroidobacteraceae bacterium]